MSVAVVRKPSRHDGLPFVTAAEEFRDSSNETTHSLLLVWLHRKSLLFPDIYYDRFLDTTLPLCTILAKGIM